MPRWAVCGGGRGVRREAVGRARSLRDPEWISDERASRRVHTAGPLPFLPRGSKLRPELVREPCSYCVTFRRGSEASAAGSPHSLKSDLGQDSLCLCYKKRGGGPKQLPSCPPSYINKRKEKGKKSKRQLFRNLRRPSSPPTSEPRLFSPETLRLTALPQA